MDGFTFDIETSRLIRVKYWNEYVGLEDVIKEQNEVDELQIWYPKKVDRRIKEYYGVVPIIEGEEFAFGDQTNSREIDLLKDENAILDEFHKNRKYKTRRAINRDELHFEAIQLKLDSNELNEYVIFYNQFAQEKGRASLNLPKVLALVKKNAFYVFSAIDKEMNCLVKNAYIISRDLNKVSLFSSSSLYRSETDKASLIGRANGYLHFQAMIYFKRQGIQTYDLGGFYNGTTDPERQRISEFKASMGGSLVNYETGFSLAFDQFNNISKNLLKYKDSISNKRIIIYGYAEWGKYIEKKLYEDYRVMPICIIDNHLSKNDAKIHAEQALNGFDPTECFIIVTTLLDNYNKICEGELLKPYLLDGNICCIRA